MDRQTDGWMDGRTDGWMDRWIGGWTDRGMDGRMDGSNEIHPRVLQEISPLGPQPKKEEET